MYNFIMDYIKYFSLKFTYFQYYFIGTLLDDRTTIDFVLFLFLQIRLCIYENTCTTYSLWKNFLKYFSCTLFIFYTLLFLVDYILCLYETSILLLYYRRFLCYGKLNILRHIS